MRSQALQRRMMTSLGLLVGLIWAHPADAYSCAQTSMAIESLICSQPQLMALDDDMEKAYRSTMDTRTQEDKRHLEADQRRWLNGRWEACGAVGRGASESAQRVARECLRVDYLARIATLKDWHPPQWATKDFTLPALPDPIDPGSIVAAMFGPARPKEDGGGHPWVINYAGATDLAGLDAVASPALIHRFTRNNDDHLFVLIVSELPGGGHHDPALIGGAIYRRVEAQWRPVTGRRVITTAGLYGHAPSISLATFGQRQMILVQSEDNYLGGEGRKRHYLSFDTGRLNQVLLLEDDFIDSEGPDGNRHCRRIESDPKVLDGERGGLPDLLITTSFSEEIGFTEERGYCEMTSKPGRTFWRDKTRLIYDGTAYCAPRPGKDARLPVCGRHER